MAEIKDIYEFAEKYLGIYTSPNPSRHMLMDGFAEACVALGFRMDTGESFSREYGADAFNDSGSFAKIAQDITDPYLLGTAIFSQWRYITHWAERELTAEDTRAWFIMALGRLAELTGAPGRHDSVFHGRIEKIQIVSSNVTNGRRAVNGEETEERLTIHDNGRVTCTISRFRADPGGHKVIRSEPPFDIDHEAVARIFDAFTEAFPYMYSGENADSDLATAPGTWKLLITNQWGRPYRTTGDMGTRVLIDGEDLSDIVREALGNRNLLVLDGNPDLVMRLEIRYRRGILPEGIPAVNKSGAAGAGGEGDEAEAPKPQWVYFEQLVVDRKSESLEHYLDAGPGHKTRTNSYVHGAITEFLDMIDPDTGFSQPQGNPPDAVPSPTEVTEYRITVHTKYGGKRVFHGTYDEKSLPPEWSEFVDRLLTFLGFFGYGEIFDEGRYGRALRRESDYVYVHVAFEDEHEPLIYLSNDPTIIDGDYVRVPVSRGKHPAIGQVVRVEYGTKEQAPYPFDRLKKIERRCTAADLASEHHKNAAMQGAE